ncbi:hypothetical protein L593_11375 [Salinarchaeum sp. Harcht-Bsk1]|uniref:DUF7344 domain-containing protein n=1 Tax=Salinarchaeum sp. Harcht-Bsk1 TaxID=1333523 RepID=UPI0003422CC9|nr:hypothetical protein [Salinarchaeum sp. Harcht-Bsk1]AGN02220.1 hypothetical protein L593_11375 [Salinarchaeum sp. Harcht-Bsk1]
MSSTASESEPIDPDEQLTTSDDDHAGTAEQGEPEPLSLDVVYDILKNTRRRRVLHLLYEDEEGTTLGDLAERIAAVENDKPRSQLDAQERKRVYVGLYQCHLPRMDDAGVVDFDGDRGTVELGTHAEQVYGHLVSAEDDSESRDWSTYYGLYGIGGVLAGLALGWTAPMAAQLFVVGLLVAGAVVLAGVHLLAERP